MIKNKTHAILLKQTLFDHKILHKTQYYEIYIYHITVCRQKYGAETTTITTKLSSILRNIQLSHYICSWYFVVYNYQITVVDNVSESLTIKLHQSINSIETLNKTIFVNVYLYIFFCLRNYFFQKNASFKFKNITYYMLN